ncbi:MAG: lipid A biosynthesis acyltransferase [Chitinophagaceae bacterium]|nr:lipid A biosynthesis acyltransferase [Chitinophagaceae bacterium]
MYYLVYGLLYSFSLLPFFILYLLSDLVYVLLYYVSGYRKDVVMYNLSIAFPDKSNTEKKAIAKQFYKNLVDTFIETIKMFSMSGEAFDKRCTIDIEAVNELAAKGKSIQLHSGHQMNWEYANWVFARHLAVQWIGIYQPLSNKTMNKIFYDMRARFKTRLVSTKEFKTTMHNLFKSQYSIGLAADQNTSPATGYWMYFFTKPAPFIMGPDKGALKNNTAVVFANFVKKKRGYYHFETSVIAESTEHYQPGELTRLYRDFLEDSINKQPANYLWTHRRWRHEYGNEFESLWIDSRKKPN